MKTLRLVAKLLGISLLILGFNSSCKKDDDDGGECITCTYTYGNVTESFTYCKDKPEEWAGYGLSWDEFVALIQAYDALSDDVTCTM